MKRAAAIAVLAALAACDSARITGVTWYNAAEHVTCTKEQHEQALAEAKGAAQADTASSGSMDKRPFAYWYGSALLRNCVVEP